MVSERVREAIILVLCIIVPNIPGAFYSSSPSFKRHLEEWYQNLNFPLGRPPDWVFGPVWLYLYTTMGIAHYFVYRTGGGWFTKVTEKQTSAYIIQLVLNWIWTPIFFFAKNLLLASVEIVALLVAVIITGLLFYKVNKWSGYLFIPYILWIAYASQFCIRVYLKN